MTEPIDDREAKLPRWAQNELARLRLVLERAQNEVREAREEFDPAEFNTILEPYGTIPKGLGNGVRVRFILPGHEWRNYIDVRVAGNGEIEAHAGSSIAVMPTASNVVRFAMADDFERARKS